ncbi:MAG TPA: hypothetical protein VH374_17420 [Polyangia bacterium]|nr:hypothetical protein [Polyangia bacterium]
MKNVRRIWLPTVFVVAFGCTPFHAPHPDAGGADGSADKPGKDAAAMDTPVGDVAVTPGPDVAADQSQTCAVMTDPKNCGACGHDCSLLRNVSTGAAVECRTGVCWIPPTGCADGFAHCSSDPTEGCETSISRPETCGSCTSACKADAPLCASTGNKQSCVSTCAAPTADKCAANCVDLQSDVNNCGACGTVCSFPNADATCVKGVCTMGKCHDGFGDCTAAAGCETPLVTTNNCGACGKACGVDHGGAACVGGTCGPVTCDPGYGNCDTSNPDCEAALTTEAHCGACGTVCSGATPLCSNVAGKQTCVSDCPTSAPMKCGNKCAATGTDVNNCGQCGTVCSFPNAVASCANGQCVMGTCKTGFADCNNQPGCETPLGTASNCARCNDACSFANATSSCDGTKCTTPVCNNGFGDCDGAPGCETVVNTPDHCGACGTTCSNPTPLCSSSTGKPTCVSDCAASTPTKCGSVCVNTTSDPNNCGMCGTGCSSPNSNASCVNSGCKFTCKDGFGDCNAQPGCETPLSSDPQNCGVCGKSCAVANAASSCAGGSCTTPVCNNGFANCNSSNPDCETQTSQDSKNCGSCGHACQSCETCQGSTCKNNCPSGKTCTGGQCCDSRMGQSCTPAGGSDCQTGTYDCNGDCVPKNKSDGVSCGPNNCPAKICMNGICSFGGINSCPTGQVCSNNGGCIVSGLRSKATLPDGSPYDINMRCQPCGAQFAVCCPGRICNDPAYPFCVKSAGEYCANVQCPAGDPGCSNTYCEQNFY